MAFPSANDNLGRDPRYPPGWWIWPGLFGGLFLWAAIYLLLDRLI